MSAIRSVLALTDFSEDAGNALKRAALVASEQRAELALLHVISDAFIASSRELVPQAPGLEASLIAGVESALEREAASLTHGSGLRVTWSVRIGAVMGEILDKAQAADLLVMGAHGTNPFRDFLLGTTAERMLGKGPCPALVVRRPPEGRYRKVIVPVDFSPTSASALNAALRVAPGAAVSVCHALEYLPEGALNLTGASQDRLEHYRRRFRDQAQAQMDELMRSAVRTEGGRVATAILDGHPAMAVLQRAAGDAADLIVIGKQGHSAMDYLLGSVTRHVLSKAQCDVLVVNRGRAG